MASTPIPLHPVSYEDVAEACTLLRDHGGDGAVTVRAVRQRLGRGSMDTLLRHVRRWKGEGGTPTPANVALSPEDRDRVLRFAEEWFAVLSAREAAGRQAEVASAQAKAAGFESELAELSVEFERLENDLMESQAGEAAEVARADRLQTSLTGKDEALAALERREAELRGQVAALTSQADRDAGRLRTLERELDAARQGRAQAETALALAESDRMRSLAREETALDEVDKARTSAMKADRRAEKLTDQIGQLQAELEAAEVACDIVKAEAALAREQAIGAEARLKALEPLLSGLLQAAAHRPQGDPANQP
jgi:chromosome segregation ATPase